MADQRSPSPGVRAGQDGARIDGANVSGTVEFEAQQVNDSMGEIGNRYRTDNPERQDGDPDHAGRVGGEPAARNRPGEDQHRAEEKRHRGGAPEGPAAEGWLIGAGA